MIDVDAVVGTARGLGCDGAILWLWCRLLLVLMLLLRPNHEDDEAVVVLVPVGGNEGDDGDGLGNIVA
jgi:hypothetical protein